MFIVRVQERFQTIKSNNILLGFLKRAWFANLQCKVNCYPGEKIRYDHSGCFLRHGRYN